jgi:hypothetical protein
MAISSSNDIFVAVQLDNATNGPRINVYRSEDGGDTWVLWGSRADSDGNTTSGFREPSLIVAEGATDQVYLAYTFVATTGVPEVRVAYSPLHVDNASWTAVAAMSGANFYSQPTLTSDASETNSYRLYLAAVESDGINYDIWVSRSTTFGASWEAPYAISNTSSSDVHVTIPRIAYGQNGAVHVAWQVESQSFSFDDAIHYRRAVNHAAGGIGDWDPAVQLTAENNGIQEFDPTVAASHWDNTVLVGFGRTPQQNGRVRVSHDGGATWPADSVVTLGPEQLELVAVGADQSFRSLGRTHLLRDVVLDSTSSVSPLVWRGEEGLNDRPYTPYGDRVAVAPNHAFGGAVGAAWTLVHTATGDTDSLMFDAEWRGVGGFPNRKPGYPITMAVPPVTPPALANLDTDPQLEIVFGDANGRIRVLDPDGTSLPGWPYDLGDFPPGGEVAIGDLDGDGVPEIVSGNQVGQVVALHEDGTLLPGFPKFINTGHNVFCSIGALVSGSARQIVACAGNQVHVLLPSGAEAPGFPAFTTVGVELIAPAAIGDVDADGNNDLVLGAGSTLRVLSNTGAVSGLRTIAGKTISGPISLADVDLDGTLEVAVPTTQGQAYLLNHDLTNYPGAWPLSGTGAISTIAFANVSGTNPPELVFDDHSGDVFAVHADGSAATGWPHGVNGGATLLASPTVDDISGGSPSVLVAASDSNGYAWLGGSADSGWPKALTDACDLSAASGDIDADGRMEAVFATRTGLMVLGFGTPQDRSHVRQQWPMYGYNSERDFCLACGNDAVTAVATGARLESTLSAVPNPSTASVTLQFAVPRRERVMLSVYDLAGRRVATVLQRDLDAGVHSVTWNGRNEAGGRVANGLYFARLVFDDGLSRRTMDRKLVRVQ